MSFSIVNSKINIYTRPIQEPLRQEKVQQVVNEPQNVVISFPMQEQEQKQYQPEPVFVPQVQPQTISQPISLPEKRKPFQLKNRERFQARRREKETTSPQTLTPVQQPQTLTPVQQLQTLTPPSPVVPLVQLPTQHQPVVPLVQLPQAQNTVENQEQFDEFGYSIDEL